MFGLWLSKMKMMKAYVSGDLPAAMKYAQKCLAKNNRDVGALWTIAECYRLQENYEKAIVYGEEAFSVDPKHMDTLQLLTEIHFDRGDYQYAHEYALKVVSLVKEIDLELQPYRSKIKENLSSSKLMPVLTSSTAQSIGEEQKTEKAWIVWAMEFITWYESTHKKI